MTSEKTLARIAGTLWLSMFLFAVPAGYVRFRFVDLGDAAATANTIRASETLFRVGIVSDLLEIMAMLLAGMTLYLLLRHIHQPAAAAMVTFVAVAAGIGCLNMLNQYTALVIATGDAYTSTFGAAGSNALTMLFADMQVN
ncbi:MAG TPA: DUF4386 domain-containing protein, partial [Acidimicrobiia bacterium]|nr:DUF4386 domain-containing protein [Acidimicrobiia bacterium]